jgi:hypothetical protein
MSYEIKQVDILDKQVEHELRFLIKDAFGMNEPIPEGHLYANTVSKLSSHPTIFLAAVEDNKIIGCNGFISTDFRLNEKLFAGYQSCWTATHPKHQGRKIFVNIINEAKKILEEKDAGFIYGVPNDNSRPIFVKKLGFKEIPCSIIQIPNIPIVRKLWLNKSDQSADYYHKNTILPVERQLADLKRSQSASFVDFQINDSYVWGKIGSKIKYGMKVKYFYIGGLELANPKDFNLLMREIYKLPVQYIQIASCTANRYNELFNRWMESSGINPFIFFELNSMVISNINIMYGSIDVF